jgi:mannosyltransferase OCH1-like enzyme
MRRLVLYSILLSLLGMLLLGFHALSTTEWKYKTMVRECGNDTDVHIPHIIHQSWKTRDLPTKYRNWHETWKQLHPDWEYRLWTDQDNYELVREEFPWFLETFIGFTRNIERADSVRYMYLFKVTLLISMVVSMLIWM